MQKKLLALLGYSLLSVMVVAGCGANDQDPPPEDDVNVEDPMNDGKVNEDGNNGTNGTNGTGGTGGTDNGAINGNNGNNDINTDNDGDMMEDHNDRGEDMVEDGLDMNDDDNKDK